MVNPGELNAGKTFAFAAIAMVPATENSIVCGPPGVIVAILMQKRSVPLLPVPVLVAAKEFTVKSVAY
jgi:hypothetical protein